MIERLHELIQACEALGYAGLIGVAAVFAVGSLSYMPRFTLYAIGGLVFGLPAIPAVPANSCSTSARETPIPVFPWASLGRHSAGPTSASMIRR